MDATQPPLTNPTRPTAISNRPSKRTASREWGNPAASSAPAVVPGLLSLVTPATANSAINARTGPVCTAMGRHGIAGAAQSSAFINLVFSGYPLLLSALPIPSSCLEPLQKLILEVKAIRVF